MQHDLNCGIIEGKDCSCRVPTNRSVILFSGGLDSTVCIAWEQKQGNTPTALFVKHGQSNDKEIDAATRVASLLQVDLRIVTVDLSQVNTQGLMQKGDFVDKGTAFVPHRNLMFISLGAMLANEVDADRLVIGSTILSAGYPDATRQFQATALEALREGATDDLRVPRIVSPLASKTKADIWRLARDLGILSIAKETYTCYANGDRNFIWGEGCGDCESCAVKRNAYLDMRADGVPA